MADRSSWCVERRLDYIAWRLDHVGSIQRGDLMRTFGLSMSQASGDIAACARLYPGAMIYDRMGTAKCYVPTAVPHDIRRPLGSVRIALLARALSWD